MEPDWYRHVTVNHAAVGSSPTTRAKYGRLAQLGERLLYTQNVGGSIPSPTTIYGDIAQLGER